MPNYGSAGEADPRMPVLAGKRRVDDALVFTVRPGASSLRTAEAFFEGGPAPSGALAEVAAYVEGSGEKASLTPLYPDRAAKVFGAGRLEMALPAAEASPYSFAGTHHLRLADPADRAKYEKKLREDGDVVRVYRPVIQYPLDFAPQSATAAAPGSPKDVDWGVRTCRFGDAWTALDQAGLPEPIAVIDQGKDYGHAELTGRVNTIEVPGRKLTPSDSIHASAVMGVLAATRADGAGMAGCCSARIDLYNVWTSEDGFDSGAFYEALRMVAGSKARVLNLSLGSTVSDSVVRDRIAECVARGMIVVAAMGNRGEAGSPRIYPAAYPGVIAVGATTRFDRKTDWSSTGEHIHLAAPGEDIFTVFGGTEYRDQNGTSFAAPMVSAAVWLVLRARPCWGLKEVKEVLAESAVLKPGVRRDEVGAGRLDLKNLLDSVRKRPCGHKDHKLI
ncbi:MAG TPA: S8 family serine peptidase [Longimicrobium sp.]|nr:S8 family serine peptidase [Longimicrobium sp.]